MRVQRAGNWASSFLAMLMAPTFAALAAQPKPDPLARTSKRNRKRLAKKADRLRLGVQFGRIAYVEHPKFSGGKGLCA